MKSHSPSLRCHAISLGCPKNRVDTERLLGSLGIPLTFIDYPNNADFIFINTCSFIHTAVQESVNTILQLVADVEELSEKPFIIVAGCFVGRYGEKVLKKDIPEVDLWLDNKEIESWNEQILLALNIKSTFLVTDRIITTGKSYAWLKISDGCQHSCSFCTIPSIRGSLNSYSIDELVKESRHILAQGVKELVLVAQDVTAWGRDLPNNYGLKTLLDHLLVLDGLKRLRLMYLYPTGLTKDFLLYLKSVGEPFVPYFDVPIQHAHSDILSCMGRPFAKNPRKVIDNIRSVFPEAVLRTSVITGFPGETEVHHAYLSKFIEEIEFQHLGIFSYIAEEGTPAAVMSNQVSEKVKEQRKAELMEIQLKISEKWLKNFVGKRLSLIVDNVHPEWPELYTGRAWFQAPEVDGMVYISGPNIKPGELIEADIIESHSYDLVALADSY